MPKYAVINADNIVENIIVWDEVSQWTPPEGRYIIKVEDVFCSIGWEYKANEFNDPNLNVTAE